MDFLKAWKANPGDWEFVDAYKSRSIASISHADKLVSGKTKMQLKTLLGDEADAYMKGCEDRGAVYTENSVKFYEWMDRRSTCILACLCV